MIGRLQTFALDCPDTLALAEFYQRLLGGSIDAEDLEWVELSGEFGTTLSFQLVADYVRPQWPGQEHPQQAHLDLDVRDIEAAQAEALAAGAVLLEDWGGTKNWRVYADPAGHPFCLCEH